MRAELPWNVAGIPPEAREAARAAARREGLSVGEWLTRRILRSLSGVEEEFQPGSGAPVDAWGLPQSAASRRDTEEMLARVSRTETESSDVSRRIEEQLRAVSRRLDSTERSQSENNRVMSKTASEINIATREQAQAFDQLANHVVGIGDRLERLERSPAHEGLKEAVKGLHLGLSRLADQITETANQSAAQVSSLAGNLEQLATRLGEIRDESETGAGLLEQRISAIEKLSQLNYQALDHARNESEDADRALAHRTDVVEKALHLNMQTVDELKAQTEAGKALAERVAAIEEATRNAAALEQRVAAIEENVQTGNAVLEQRVAVVEESVQAGNGFLEQRVAATEKASQSNTNALDHALERLEAQAVARAGDLAEAQKRETQTEVALMRLEENLSRLENKIPDSSLGWRLDGVDRSLADIVQRIEQHPTESLGETVRALTQRIETLDKQHQELLGELRASQAAATATTTPSSVEPPPLELEDIFAPQPPAAEVHPETPGESSAFTAPPFIEQPPVAPFGADEFDSLSPGFNAADPFAGGFAPDHFASQAFEAQGEELSEAPAEEVAGGSENFLTAARRSAQAAAEAETTRGTGPFAWRREHQAETAKPRARFLVPAILVFLMLLALAASFVLNQRMKAPTAVNKPIVRVIPAPTTPAKTMPAPETATNQTAGIAPATPTQQVEPAAQPPIGPAAPVPAAPVAPVKQEAVKTPNSDLAKVKPVAPAAGDTISPGDRLAKLADAGNATAQTILGIRYLDGQGGGPVDVQQAGKWLLKAAAQNQAVAQYRLGTMYERGQGTPIDMTRAVKWYQAAANLGNRKAMHNLAVAYADGALGKKDMAEAARWFTKAATLGLSDSQFNLAVLYERGDGVPQSLIDAYKWYAIAAGQGDTESKQRLSQLQTQLSDADRAAAQKSAASFRAAPLNRAANVPPDVGDLPAQ